MTTQPTDELVEKVVKDFEQKMELYDMGIGLEVLMFDWLRTQLTTLLADCEGAGAGGGAREMLSKDLFSTRKH